MYVTISIERGLANESYYSNCKNIFQYWLGLISDPGDDSLPISMKRPLACNKGARVTGMVAWFFAYMFRQTQQIF